MDWASFLTEVGTRVVDGETSAGWVLQLDLLMEEQMLCFVQSSPPRLISLFFRCQNSLQQHRSNDGYDGGIVFSRAPWPGCP